MPALQLLVSAQDRQRLSPPVPFREDTSSQPHAPDKLLVCSENGSQAISDYHLAYPSPQPMSISGSVFGGAGDHWRTSSLEELCHLCDEVSISRPLYMVNGQSTKLEQDSTKSTDSKREPDELDLSTSGQTGKAKHAASERARREKHKLALQKQYQRINNTALKEAGWDLNSDKAPTKEIIMDAMIIQDDMYKRRNVLIKTQFDQMGHELRERDRTIKQKDRTIREYQQTIERLRVMINRLSPGGKVFKESFELDSPSLKAQLAVDQPMAAFAQHCQVIEDGGQPRNMVKGRPVPSSSPEVRCGAPIRSGESSEVQAGCCNSCEFGHVKRKRA